MQWSKALNPLHKKKVNSLFQIQAQQLPKENNLETLGLASRF
jgi:hypothetical protein